MARKRQIFFAILALIIMAVIFYNSSLPGHESSKMSGALIVWLRENLGLEMTSFSTRKLAHFAEYTALGFCLLPAVGENILPKLTRRCVPAAFIGILYAVSDEFHQYFVPGRSCELRDMCIDAVGVVLGVAISVLLGFDKKRS